MKTCACQARQPYSREDRMVAIFKSEIPKEVAGKPAQAQNGAVPSRL